MLKHVLQKGNLQANRPNAKIWNALPGMTVASSFNLYLMISRLDLMTDATAKAVSGACLTLICALQRCSESVLTRRVIRAARMCHEI